MNILLLGVGFLLLFDPGLRREQAPCLKVMSFNIRYGTAPDGENNWPMRKDQLTTVIRDFSPDVLGVQEALRFQMDELREAFPEYSEVGVGRDDGKTSGEYSSLFYRTSRLSLDSTGTFWFSDTPSLPGSKTWGNNYPRICTWAIFLDRETGSPLAVFNVHWDHESQYSRERSALLLVQHIEQTAAGIPVAVTGDFNAGEQNRAIESLKGSLRDSFRELHPADSLTGTYHAFRGTREGEKIDHIFVDSRLRIDDATIIRTQENGRYPSDHFPVTATICFPQQ
ncbi:MAG: endonuclease/exonuclease/phosphatase family protein [Bacteroidota bacterium]